MVHKSNDILLCTTPKTKYLIWWQMADKSPALQRMGETMARLICRASRLKADDTSLREASYGAKMCQNCEFGVVESLYHMTMQCPFMTEIRHSMYSELEKYVQAFSDEINANPQSAFSMIIGRLSDKLDINSSFRGLEITGKHICLMYRLAISTREGIG